MKRKGVDYKKRAGLHKLIVDFSSVKDVTVGEVFGKEQTITKMNKALWKFINDNCLRTWQ